MNRITPLILAVALFMELMDATVIATALPAIAADIGTEPIALKLAMTAYLVSLAIFIPISGWMADRFGARNVFRWAIFVFMLGSVACAMSNSLTSFVGSRFFQGMGGSMMTPLARLVLVRGTPKKDLVSAMAWLTVPALVGPLAGPPIGGFLTTYFSWHWIFLINIPIGTIGIILAGFYLPHFESRGLRPIDWLGFVMVGTGFAGLLFGISVVSLPALPPIYGIVTCSVGLVSMIAYIFYSRRIPYPILDFKVLNDRMFRTAILGGFILRLGMGATPFLFPLMLQIGFGKTPFYTGLITLFGALGAILAKLFVEKVYIAYGFQRPMLVMALLSAAVLGMIGFFDIDTPVWLMISTMLFAGLVRSTFFTGVNAMSFAEVPDELAGQATALSSVSVHLSFALGVALAGVSLEFLTSRHGPEIGRSIIVADFQITFFIVAIVAAFAFIPFLFLPRHAGSTVSGHKAPEKTSVDQESA